MAAMMNLTPACFLCFFIFTKLLVVLYADFHRKLPFFADYAASEIDIGISHRSMDNSAPKKNI
jgi:hypothetical protein